MTINTLKDIDESQIRLARMHAQKAGVDKYVHFQRMDMRDFSSRYAHGVIITNPPYGERLGTLREVEQLYKEIGVHFRSLSPWQVYIITSLR